MDPHFPGIVGGDELLSGTNGHPMAHPMYMILLLDRVKKLRVRDPTTDQLVASIQTILDADPPIDPQVPGPILRLHSVTVITHTVLVGVEEGVELVTGHLSDHDQVSLREGTRKIQPSREFFTGFELAQETFLAGPSKFLGYFAKQGVGENHLSPFLKKILGTLGGEPHFTPRAPLEVHFTGEMVVLDVLLHI
jgi:hypothetical protein